MFIRIMDEFMCRDTSFTVYSYLIFNGSLIKSERVGDTIVSLYDEIARLDNHHAISYKLTGSTPYTFSPLTEHIRKLPDATLVTVSVDGILLHRTHNGINIVCKGVGRVSDLGLLNASTVIVGRNYTIVLWDVYRRCLVSVIDLHNDLYPRNFLHVGIQITQT